MSLLPSTLFSPKTSLSLFFGALFWLFSPLSASAYLDPGSGSFVVQVVVASFLGIAFTLKTFWHSITYKVAQLFSATPKKNAHDPDSSQNV